MAELNHLALRRDLLAWFAANGRDLPWRHSRDPFEILVAETMLQQTQVERVIPKYHAFLAAFPNAEALAAAPTAEVIRMWAGLGYNRRAVNLQRAAQAVIAAGGAFPRTPAELRQLPGVGPYTAGAVACFAFELPVVFMDTNIRRVLERLGFAPAERGGGAEWERRVLALGEELLAPEAAWAWNQAIMELGALICTARRPACQRCPLRAHCTDYAARLAADAEPFAVANSAAQRPLRRVAEQPEAPFVGSRRYYRGLVVAILRELPPSDTIGFGELGARLRSDYTPEAYRVWLEQLLADLARDGLVALVTDTHVRLP